MTERIYASETFETSKLLACDFDGTQFNTFEPSPNGIGVDEAYKIGIEKVFYFDRNALNKYEADGEHRNRSPLEIVHSLAPNTTSQGLQKLTQELTQAKLDIILDQIGNPLADGTPWPRPVPGFKESWSKIHATRESGVHIVTAGISAGHNAFIKKSFEVAKLPYPDILVTEETIQGLYSGLPLEKLFKPSVLPFWLVKMQWVNQYANNGEDFEQLMESRTADRVLYVGDDENKDKKLANNVGVSFVLIDKDRPRESWRKVESILKLGDVAIKGS